MPVFIALLRAVGPATHRKMLMRDLRDGCIAAGLTRVETYIQTGNVIIKSSKPRRHVQAILIRVLRGFDLSNEVILRQPADFAALVETNPFPDAVQSRPSRLAVFFVAAAPSAEGVDRLFDHRGPERVIRVGADLRVDYADGIAGSTLAPARVERLLGVAATARNWNSVRALWQRAQAMTKSSLPA
jgi:uncharacterized protein (DUF1697 family)